MEDGYKTYADVVGYQDEKIIVLYYDATQYYQIIVKPTIPL
ncbi:MAG: hypothetical protein R3Y35_06700 [Clostridia bacterium]